MSLSCHYITLVILQPSILGSMSHFQRTDTSFSISDHLGFYALQWSVSLRCTVSQARTRRLILMEQRVGGERGEFLEAALVLPPALASRRRWHGAEQQEKGAHSEWDQPKQWCPAALLRRGPACHLDLISTEHESQFWSKRTPGNKAILCQSILFSCSVFPTFSVIAGSHCQGY